MEDDHNLSVEKLSDDLAISHLRPATHKVDALQQCYSYSKQ